MNFGKRVRKARVLKGLSQKELGDIVGLKQSTISEMESSVLGNTPKIEEIAKALGTTVDYLKSGIENELDIVDIVDIYGHPVNLKNYIWVPRYDIKASAGHGCAISEENRIDSFPFPKDVAKELRFESRSNLIVIGVKGDSMLGEIDDGDNILVDRDIIDPSTGIFVIRLENELLVKRILRKPGGIIDVISSNPLYPMFTIDMNEPPSDFSVIGKVLWSGSIKKM